MNSFESSGKQEKHDPMKLPKIDFEYQRSEENPDSHKVEAGQVSIEEAQDKALFMVMTENEIGGQEISKELKLAAAKEFHNRFPELKKMQDSQIMHGGYQEWVLEAHKAANRIELGM